MKATVLELAGVIKDYRALRPLRIDGLSMAGDDHVAILGLDQPAAEILVNLITGATLPDRGEVRVFGRPTSAIQDGDEWLKVADRFGIVSERAVLLEGLSVVQNLAVPFSLEIEPPGPDLRSRAEHLGAEVGLGASAMDRLVGQMDPATRFRVRLARGLAFDPDILLLEHPSAGIPREDVRPLAEHVRQIGSQRRIAMLSLTADRDFARDVGARILTLEGATGRLSEPRKNWLGGWR